MVMSGKQVRIGFVLFFALALVGCGGGGGTTVPTSEPGYTLSGIATKGPVKNGTVSIYAIDDQGQKLDPALATVTTDFQGNYTATIDHDGPVLIEVNGGSYRDEATGVEITLARPMRACLPTFAADIDIAVTPLTEVAVRMAEVSGLSSETISAANDRVSELVGCDIVTTRPADLEGAEQFDACSAEAQTYAIILAAISQMAETMGADVFEVIDEMEADIQDAELDEIGDEFLTAVNDYLASEENKTGIEDAGQINNDLPTIIKKYSIKPAHITYRVYESGQAYVLFSADITKMGGPIDEATITTQTIGNAAGQTMPPDTSGFYLMHHVGLDCLSIPGTCSSTGVTRRTGIFDSFATLAADTYTAQITMDNGQLVTVDGIFPGLVAVPFVASNTMTAQWSGDDLELSWANPVGAENWSEVDWLRIILTDGLGNETLHISLPPNVQTVTIPAATLAQAASLRGGGTMSGWQVQSLAFDEHNMNFARGNSNSIALPRRYAVNGAQITYRNYENGTTMFLLSTELSNSTDAIAVTDVTQMTLTETGAANAMAPIDNGTYRYRFMWYDCGSGECAQSGPVNMSGVWQRYSNVPAAVYEVDLGLQNGQALSATRNFPGMVALPYVSAASMTSAWSAGNLVFSWTNPADEANWDSVNQMRVVILDELGNEIVFAAVAPGVASLSIPEALVLEAARLRGGSKPYLWQVQTRAYDADEVNYAQGYSNRVPLASRFTVRQHHAMYRHYEDGTGDYMLVVNMADNSGQLSPGDVQTITLQNSTGTPVAATNGAGQYQAHCYWYNCSSGTCSPAVEYKESGVWQAFASLDTNESYGMHIGMDNAQTIVENIIHAGALVLPFIPSASMTSVWNGGDLALSWTNPDTDPNWDAVDQIRITLFDDLGNDSLYIHLPVTAESLTIPADLVAKAAALRGGLALDAWRTETRAFDDEGEGENIARGYSNTVLLQPDPLYSFYNPNISYRNYESVPGYFVTSVQVGSADAETDIVSAAIKDAAGNPLVPADSGFYRFYFIYYQCLSDPLNCVQGGPYEDPRQWQTFTNLPAGSYTFDVTMENGQQLQAKQNCQGKVVLPYISANSMSATWNSGSLELSWTNPEAQPNWNLVSQVRIFIFDDLGAEVLLIMAQPTATGVTIPVATVAAAAVLRGGTTLSEWQIHTYVADGTGMNYARGFSDRIPLP